MPPSFCMARECFAESLSKRKAAAKSSRGETTPSNAKNGSPSKKKPRLPFAEKTQVGTAPSSSAKVKHLVGAYSTKVGGMCGARVVLPEPPVDMLENHDMLREAARTRPSSTERQRDVDIPLRSSSRRHRSKDGDRSGRSAHNPAIESRAVKCGVDSVSLTPLEVRLAEAKKMRESSARAKGSSSASAADPKVDKSNPAGDAIVSDMLKMNFMSSPCACFNWAAWTAQMEMIPSMPLEMETSRCPVLTFSIADQASGAVEDVAGQADAKDAIDQGSPVGVSE
ncbi:unnamed protein product [Prunus brigantina]